MALGRIYQMYRVVKGVCADAVRLSNLNQLGVLNSDLEGSKVKSYEVRSNRIDRPEK